MRLYRNYRPEVQGTIVLAARAPYLRRLAAIAMPVEREAVIVDLGCGDGSLLQILAERGYENVSGVDASPSQVALARDAGLSVQEANVLDWLHEAPDAWAHVIVAFDVLEHFTKSESLQLLDDAHRVLRPGGTLVVHVPNASSIFSARVRYADCTHEQAFTRESLTQLFRAAGFAAGKCYEDTPVVHGFWSACRWILWKCARGLLRFYWAIETGDSGSEAIFSQNLLAVTRRNERAENV